MDSPEKFTQAMRLFAERENLPATLDSEAWESVPREIRERAFWMSKLTDAEILQEFREVEDDVIAGKIGLGDANKRLKVFLDERGYVPTPGTEGGLQDLSSLRRIGVVVNTNRDMARGHARWLSNQQTLRAFPGQRLVRVADRDEKRDWLATWREAMADLGEATMAVMIQDAGESGGLAGDVLARWMIAAPVNDPIWEAISRFRQPYPPFDWGSGVGIMPLGRGKSRELGIIPPPGDPRGEPQSRSLNETLEATPRQLDEDLKDALAEKLGRFGEWDGEKMVFTDPDGTRPHTAARLAEIWAKPAPAGFERILQKEALEAWDEGQAPDVQESRVILRRLFDRIENQVEPPPVLHRDVRMDAATAVDLVRALSERRLVVPGRVAGWSWAETPARLIGEATGWMVHFVLRGVRIAKDLRALRPGKPGWVTVGGREYRVRSFVQDPRARRIEIELEEPE